MKTQYVPKTHICNLLYIIKKDVLMFTEMDRYAKFMKNIFEIFTQTFNKRLFLQRPSVETICILIVILHMNASEEEWVNYKNY